MKKLPVNYYTTNNSSDGITDRDVLTFLVVGAVGSIKKYDTCLFSVIRLELFKCENMRYLFFWMVLLPFFGNAQNENFNGIWKQEHSDYLLVIDLNANENKQIQLYNSETEDLYYQTIFSVEKNKIIAYKHFDDNSEYSVLYELISDSEIYCNLNNEVILTYKRQPVQG